MMRRLVALAAAVIAFNVSVARAEDIEGDLVIIPMPAGETLSVSNLLGGVRLRGWDEPQVRITAQKRAGAPDVLDRLKVRVDVRNGELHVAAGVYFRDGKWREVPLSGAGIDLTIDAPRGMTLAAHTFNGDLDASGFVAGARLETEQGEIRAADIDGKVDTHTLAGRQSLAKIHGPVDASGVDGDVELASIDGATVDAVVHAGQITARELRSPVVRLRTARGTIVYIGALVRGGRYEMTSLDGDVRMTVRESPFTLSVKAPVGRVELGFPLADRNPAPDVVEGEYDGGGPSLALASVQGQVSVRFAK